MYLAQYTFTQQCLAFWTDDLSSLDLTKLFFLSVTTTRYYAVEGTAATYSMTCAKTNSVPFSAKESCAQKRRLLTVQEKSTRRSKGYGLYFSRPLCGVCDFRCLLLSFVASLNPLK